MTPDNLYGSEQFKKCAGKGCPNVAKHRLKIKYVEKVGGFCDSCTADLLHQQIAIIHSPASGKRETIWKGIKLAEKYAIESLEQTLGV
jgi:hypothetical protein